MAELRFFTGTMDSGKSTLAMQMAYNLAHNGRHGLLLTAHDRSGPARITSRIGLSSPALEVTPELDLLRLVERDAARGAGPRWLVCDEAQFYTPAQIDQLAHIVDDLGVDVYAFGITTDFRASLFPGSERLVELADRVEVLQLETLCWCGARGTHNARVVNGAMVMDGPQVALGDTYDDGGNSNDDDDDEVRYVVLCRRHHMRRQVARD